MLPCTDKPFQNDGILDRYTGIRCKFGEHLYIVMAFFSVLFGDFELVRDFRNTSDKIKFFLLSVMLALNLEKVCGLVRTLNIKT